MLLSSCKKTSLQIERKQGVSIDLNRNDLVSIFDLFTEIELIPLETNDESILSSPLGEPDEVRKYDDKYYFLDRKQHSILIFDKEGQFFKKIDKRGGAPEEYISLEDFQINRFTGNIEILSAQGRCINIYDSYGDIFIGKIKFSKEMPVCHRFHHLSSDIYAFYSFAGNIKITFYSQKENKVFESAYNIPKWYGNNTTFFTGRNPFYLFRDSLFFAQKYNGDVFTVSPSNYELEPHFEWDFGKSNFDLSILPENESIEYYSELIKKINIGYAVNFQIAQENSRYYFTRFKYENRYKHLIFDKLNNSYVLFEEFQEGGWCIPLWIDEENIYAFVSPFYLDKVISLPVLDEKNKLKYLSIKDDDNLIIVKYKLK